MIYFFNAKGELLSFAPDRVFQGSALVNTLYLISPLPCDTAVTVSFTLPDGSIIGKQMMSVLPKSPLANDFAINGQTLSVWQYALDTCVTQLHGVVQVCFYAVGLNGERLSTCTTTFTVEKGVPVTEPKGDGYEQVLEFIAGIKPTIENLQQDNREYVDGKIADTNACLQEYESLINDIYNINKQAGVYTYKQIEHSYSARHTAGGRDFVDGTPSKLKKIKGSSVKISNIIAKSYEPYRRTSINGIDWTVREDGAIVADGSTNLGSSYVINNFDDIFPAGTYTVSLANAKVGQTRLKVTNEDGSLELIFPGSSNTALSRTFTLSKPERLKIECVIDLGRVIDFCFKPMLNIGISALEYMPYDGYQAFINNSYFKSVTSKNPANTISETIESSTPIELAAFDYVLPEERKLIRKSGKIVVDGTENWYAPQGLGKTVFQLGIGGVFENVSGTFGEWVSSIYLSKASVVAEMPDKSIKVQNNSIYIVDDNFSTVEDFKAHLVSLYAKGYPLTIIYKAVSSSEESVEFNKTEYRAYKGGTERFLQGEATLSYGAYPTLTQEYIACDGKIATVSYVDQAISALEARLSN